jgi:hypothetical protein
VKNKSDEWLYIWDIKPQRNGTLRAKHLKALPLPNEESHSFLSFNERMAARCMEKRIDVYWWNDCTDKRLVRCTLRQNFFLIVRDITSRYVLFAK